MREQAVRDTLPHRPAGIIKAAPHNVQNCFAGIFNGAHDKAWLRPDGSLFIGKAECEWDWQDTWGALKELGLVEWRLEERPNHPGVGGATTYFIWNVTDKGFVVREDAMREDVGEST